MSAERIHFSTIDVPLPHLDFERVIEWIVLIADDVLIQKVDYRFCSDEHILVQNRLHLQHDEYTDIITFQSGGSQAIRADILISTERVLDNASSRGVKAEQELLRVIAHGMLHCLGQGDKSSEEALQMRQKEEAALNLWSQMA